MTNSLNLDAYVKALIPNPYHILGVKLLPFSLGHYFLMKRFNCGFSNESVDKYGGFEDVLLAIAICSRKYEQFIEWINDESKFMSWSKEWGTEILKALKENKLNCINELNRFKIYMKDSIMVPKFWNNDEEDDKTSGAHWTQNVYTILISKMGYTSEQALNIPLSQALFDYYKYLENEGVITFMADWELEQWKASDNTK